MVIIKSISYPSLLLFNLKNYIFYFKYFLNKQDNKALVDVLRNKNIYQGEIFRKKEGDFSKDELFARNAISIPIFPELTNKKQEYSVPKTNYFIKEFRI